VGDQRNDNVMPVYAPVIADSDASMTRPWSTVWVWVLAFMPWVVAVGVVLSIAATVSRVWSMSSAYPDWIWVVPLLVPYLLTVAVAALDAGKLRRWQHTTVAPWAWAWLGAPVYLVVRSMALTPRPRRGLRPMWTGLVNAAAATIVVAVGFAVIAALAAWLLAAYADAMGANG